MEEEREEEPEQPEKREGQAIRHAALAQERQTVPVTADIRIRNWHGFAEAQTSLVNAGLVEAVSSQTVPPFEAPTGVPTFIGQRGGTGIGEGTTAQSAISEPRGVAITPSAIPARPNAAAAAADPFGATTQNVGNLNLRNPAIVEDRLAFALASAVEPGPGQARPVPERRGAHLSSPAQLDRIAVGDVAAWQSYMLQQRIDAFLATELALKETFILESFLTAAVIYGTFKSYESIREFLNARSTPFQGRGAVQDPTNLTQGGPAGARPVPIRPRSTTGAVAAGTGDIPGQGNFLREFRAGLRQGEQP